MHPRERSPLGCEQDRWRLVLEPWGPQGPRVLPYRPLSIRGLRLPGLSRAAGPGSLCPAQGARLAPLLHPRRPQPMAPRGRPSLPGRRGLGRIKQAEGKAGRPRGLGAPAPSRARRDAPRCASAAPQSGSKPVIAASPHRAAPLPGERRPASPSSPFPGAAAPSPEPAPGSLRRRSQAGKETWGGDALQRPGLSLPLPQPSGPRPQTTFTSGHEAWARPGPLPAPLTATMPPSALRSTATLPQPPAAPHATPAAGPAGRGVGTRL